MTIDWLRFGGWGRVGKPSLELIPFMTYSLKDNVTKERNHERSKAGSPDRCFVTRPHLSWNWDVVWTPKHVCSPIRHRISCSGLIWKSPLPTACQVLDRYHTHTHFLLLAPLWQRWGQSCNSVSHISSWIWCRVKPSFQLSGWQNTSSWPKQGLRRECGCVRANLEKYQSCICS